MNIAENQSSQTAIDDDHYNSDEGRPHDELLQKIIPRYSPSPSPPPAVALPQVSPDSSPEPPSQSRKGSNRSKPKNRPNQGDAVLVAFMAEGKRPEIARTAGQEPLQSDDEEDETSFTGGDIVVDVGEKREEARPEPQIDPQLDLMAIAAGAMAQAVTQVQEAPKTGLETACSDDGPGLETNGSTGEAMEGMTPAIPSIKLDEEQQRKPYTSDMRVKTELHSPQNRPVQIDGPVNSGPGDLPPILPHSPHPVGLSNGNGVKLPSITDQLGDLNHLTDVVGTPTFSQSPPGRPGPPGFPPMGHGSPSKSPNDTFRRELPSPGRAGPFWRRPSQADTPQYANAADYSSSNTETPSTDQSVSTPAMAMGIDRMSIDNMTNPQIGGFQCTYAGCTAQPFQTQYLLNSHANVHSSNRPHYCSVKGCPRSEGGKGFKRKNEMIRHGLVHDSPGYVCPFCPDREHKYPRPDNLQRHVRVHHVDRDKDDAQLRDVLSQRPEGPSRGRRRRGGTS